MVWLRSDKEDLMELHIDRFKILTHLKYCQIWNTDQFKILTNWKQMLINWNALASTNVNWTSCTFAAEWAYFQGERKFQTWHFSELVSVFVFLFVFVFLPMPIEPAYFKPIEEISLYSTLPGVPWYLQFDIEPKDKRGLSTPRTSR